MYPVSKRGTVMAWFNVALSVGSALGFVIGGQVAHLMDGVAGREGWRWAFLIVVPPGLLLGVWSFFRKDPPRGAAEAAAASHRFRVRDALLLFKIPSYLYNVAGMTLMTFAVGGMSFWMPKYIHEFRLGHSPEDSEKLAQVNLVFGTIVVVTGLAGTIVGGYLGDYLRPRLKGGGAYLTLSGWAMMAAFPFFLLVLYLPFPWAWGALGVCLFLAFLNTGPTNTVIANVVPPAMRATGYAVAILVLHALGDAISPPLIGAIADRFKTPDGRGNMNLAFSLVGGCIFLAGVFWKAGARHLARDTELAPTRR
jgi:predicted MFS family arabinose efflux permease